MKRWNTIAALLLLGLWAACSINCACENLSGVEALSCCSDAGEDSGQTPVHASQCVCSVLMSGACVPHSQDWFAVLPADLILSSFGSCADDLPARPACLAVEHASPPELAGSWQFTFRAALPARPPSLVS